MIAPLHAGGVGALGVADAAVLVAVGGALAWYLGAARRLRDGRRAWPAARTGAVAGGCAALALAAGAPAVVEGPFTAHMAQHLLIGMVAPLLLALSAPVTLALRAHPRARPALGRLLHLRGLRVAAHPVVAAAVGIGGLGVLSLTPLYGAATGDAALHALVHAHVLLWGCLLTWALIGADPMPGRASTGLRIGVLLAAMAAHAAIAKLMYAHGPAAAGVPGGDVGDWQDGARLMFYGGDLVELCLLVVLMARWYAARGRALAVGR